MTQQHPWRETGRSSSNQKQEERLAAIQKLDLVPGCVVQTDMDDEVLITRIREDGFVFMQQMDGRPVRGACSPLFIKRVISRPKEKA